MANSDYCLERVLMKVSECIFDHLDTYLAERLNADTQSGEGLYGPVLPSLVGDFRGGLNSFPNSRQTPSIFIAVIDQQFDMNDASDTYDALSIVSINVALSSKDLQTTNPNQFQNSVTAYVNGIVSTLMQHFHKYGCHAGAYSCIPVRAPYGPMEQMEGDNSWYRVAQVEVEISHKVSR